MLPQRLWRPWQILPSIWEIKVETLILLVLKSKSMFMLNSESIHIFSQHCFLNPKISLFFLVLVALKIDTSRNICHIYLWKDKAKCFKESMGVWKIFVEKWMLNMTINPQISGFCLQANSFWRWIHLDSKYFFSTLESSDSKTYFLLFPRWMLYLNLSFSLIFLLQKFGCENNLQNVENFNLWHGKRMEPSVRQKSKLVSSKYSR